MTSRYIAVLAAARPPRAVPGVDAEEFRLAMLEDTYEVIAGLELVTAVVAVPADDRPAAEAIIWPGTAILALDPGRDQVADTFDGLRELGAEQGAVVAADAPDLPPLLIGKLFRALGGGEVVVCPAEGGGLVALAARLPAPEWMSGIGLDTSNAPARLRAAAPGQGAVRSAPGWHRLRDPVDLDRLDPGLEGWENTRALLAGHRRH